MVPFDVCEVNYVVAVSRLVPHGSSLAPGGPRAQETSRAPHAALQAASVDPIASLRDGRRAVLRPSSGAPPLLLTLLHMNEVVRSSRMRAEHAFTAAANGLHKVLQTPAPSRTAPHHVIPRHSAPHRATPRHTA
ncbi:Protein of unknown function, partial [Gryllus bimaculatus]